MEILQNSAAERRQTRRYPLRLDLEYAMIGAGAVTTGTGSVIDISSTGIRFSAVQAPPAEDKLISIALCWPVNSAGGTPLKLLVWGQVRRRSANEVVVRFRKYEIQGLADLDRPSDSAFDWRLGGGANRRSCTEAPDGGGTPPEDDALQPRRD